MSLYSNGVSPIRPFLITILTFIVLNASAQPGKVKVFKKTDYINGNFYRQLYDTVRGGNEKVDVYFLKRHFYMPYYLPEKFVDKQKRNQRISIWRDPKGKKDQVGNWENTYTYDSLGRVINFTYSSCIICSSLPYDYSVIYNPKGHIEQIFDARAKDRFKFYYNGYDEMVRFEKYSGDKLETTIALMN